ncbi:tyrosine-type recombinase/integrase [Nocardia thailandica]|uniref:Tyrosine-type recombinase/integrase n=1 Tax=Nocardia thailandica TaxID=257275 RepID=A0ABW6PWW3_9NOCA
MEREPELRVPLEAAAVAVLDGFTAHLAGQRLAERTRGTYTERVRHFLTWVTAQGGGLDPLASPADRDQAVAAYLAAAVDERAVSSSTINVTRAALAAFYAWLHPGGGFDVDAAARDAAAPRTLGDAEVRALLRGAAARGPRCFAMAVVLLDAGPTEWELAGLDVGDVGPAQAPDRLRVTGTDGVVRLVPIEASTRVAVTAWLAQRREVGTPASEQALFTSIHRRGRGRLALRTIDATIRAAGLDAGLDVSPRTLRATAEARMVRAGLSPAVVAARLGLGRHDAARRAALLGVAPERVRVALTASEQLSLFGDIA